MPIFDISFMRVDRDEDPTIVEALFRTVDWPALPREGEGLGISPKLDPATVESDGGLSLRLLFAGSPSTHQCSPKYSVGGVVISCGMLLCGQRANDHASLPHLPPICSFGGAVIDWTA